MGEQLWRWARRNRTVAVLGALLTLLVLGVAIGSSLAALRIRAARDESVRRLVHLHANEATSRVRRGEDLLAIPHLLAALRSARDPWVAELLRLRLGCTLAAVPQPVAMGFLDAMITDLAVGPGGVVAAGTGAGAVWWWRPAPAGEGTDRRA